MSEGETPELIRVEGEPSKAKDLFYKTMENRVNVIDDDEYKQVVGPNSIFAHYDGVVYQIPEGKEIGNAIIYVNEEDFFVDEEDYTDLIPIAVRHEIAELWAYAKTGYSLSPPPTNIGKEGRVAIGHGLALREEWKHAFELGKSDRYLEFVKKQINSSEMSEENRQRIIGENVQAHDLAKTRYQRENNTH